MAKRIKNRYILAETSAEVDMHSLSSQRSLEERLSGILGLVGYSHTNPKIIPLQQKRFILRLQRSSEEQMIVALSFIKEINGARTGIYTLKTSGTIKSLKQSLINNKQE